MSSTAGRNDRERRGAPRAQAPCVLVVDDSTAIRRIIRRTLEGAGYQVEEATDGREALNACRMMQPDLVLLDVDMPVMDGMAALEAMRAEKSLSSIPVLFLTARTGGEDVARGLHLGAQDYLRKPCVPVELVARVTTALRLSEREQDLARKAREADEASALDPLTGLGNRRFLESRTNELATSASLDAVVGVSIVDVDHFKRVNDEHGHPAGDMVLRMVSRRLTSALSEGTLVRWGGEEFLALLPGFTGARLAGIGEQIRASISQEPFAVGALQLPVTASVGCASGPLHALKDVLKAADDALYDAKRSGRDRVVLASA